MQDGSVRREREHQSRTHDRAFSADGQRVGPQQRHRKSVLPRAPPHHTRRHKQRDEADKADVLPADNEYVERAALTETFSRSARELITITKERSFKDARRLDRKSLIDQSEQLLPPFVDPVERQKHALVVQA